MPKFSNKSDMALDTCHPLLQVLFREVIKESDCVIVEGHRTRRRQNQLYLEGLSKVKWPDGKHNTMPAQAVDAAPYIQGKIPWDEQYHFHRFSEVVFEKAKALNIKIRWGGDWDGDGDTKDQKFNDLAHYELLSTEKETL